jgi:hypothetical protein
MNKLAYSFHFRTKFYMHIRALIGIACLVRLKPFDLIILLILANS